MSAKDGKVFYLGKNGRVFGPYPMEKLDELRLNGQLLNFTYIWDENNGEWQNIDPMPPKPGATTEKRKGGGSLDAADAICHDHNALVAGKLHNISDMGCDLVSRDHADSPVLALNSTLVLNVLDNKGEKATNIRAAVHEISHEDGAWVYHIRWAHRPTF